MAREIVFHHPATADLLSIIVPVAADAGGLELTLQSFMDHGLFGERVEVIVANDGGFAETAAVCARFPVRQVVLTPNQGSYAARNAALAVSHGAYIAFIDADEQVTPGWLPAMRRALQQAQYVAGPVQIDPTKVRSLAQRLDALTAFPINVMLERIKFAPTANLAIHRSVVERLGGFSDWMRTGGDVEFGRRVHEAGMRQLYEPAAILLHPPRDFRQQIRKIGRTTTGEKMLRERFPEWFPRRRFHWYIRPFLPPRRITWGQKKRIPIPLREKVALYSLLYVKNIIQGCYRYLPGERYDWPESRASTPSRPLSAHRAALADE